MHYWEFVQTYISHHDTVKYINFHYEEGASNKEKGIGWVLLILIEKELLKIINEVVENPAILKLYHK